MVQATPPASASSSLDWHVSGTTTSTDSSSKQHMQRIVDSMRGTLSDAAGNTQRLYDK